MKIIYEILILLLLTNTMFTQYVYKWYSFPSGTTNNLYSVGIYSGYHWIAGASGTILTDNFGSNWTLVNSGTSSDLRSVFTTGNAFFICGSNGTILKSTNSGFSWISLNTGISSVLNSLSYRAFSSIMSVGNSGTVIYTTNLGQTWTLQPAVTTNDLNSCANTVVSFTFRHWIVGNNGTILRSSNSGSNWSMQNSGSSQNLNCVQVLDTGNLWVVGNGGTILKTTNGGANWLSVSSGTNANLNSIHINSFGYGWIVGSSGTMLRTTNGGLNWELQIPVTNIDLHSVYCAGGDDGIAVGNNGLILERQIDSSYLPYVILDGNNISSVFNNMGTFDQNITMSGTPGLEWPKGSGQFAVYTAGLTIAALYNGQLRTGSAFFSGEYLPGHVVDSAGIPVGRTDSFFKFYKVKRNDNMNSNSDWAKWGYMVPYGAPFIDVNQDGVYEPDIDTPGVKNAVQTIFICITDAFPEIHYVGGGFGGGTLPLKSEVHLTAWCYDAPDLMDVQFIKWNVINKSYVPWYGTHFTLVSDPDVGCAEDDIIGCDSSRSLGYCYNFNEVDCVGPYRYTGVVPAFGFLWLRCPGIPYAGITSITYVGKPSNGFPLCEHEPYQAIEAYNFMRGYKGDETPWVIPPGGPQNITRYCYSGDPETGTGWCEAQSSIVGRIANCGGPNVTTGNFVNTTYGGDRRLILNSGSDDLTMNPGDTQRILIAQLIAVGVNRKNSVTRLKTLADTVRAICSRGFLTGLEPPSASIPTKFQLFQNYPNPFNSSTKIKFSIPFDVSNFPSVGLQDAFVNIELYDILGRKVTTLVNSNLRSGIHVIEWNGTGYASGVYFYRLSATSGTGQFTLTKKLVLVK